jgi:peptidoglycan/LPS O-acetylase OafA/YrhL
MREPAEEGGLAALHGLRGVAALGVAVFFHYIHFGGGIAEYPFASTEVAGWLYANGWLLVDLFFLLSGVIFTYRYLEPVAGGAVTGRQFFVLRLSRLYPLHLFTLGVCAAVEWTLLWFHQAPVVYDRVDLYNFFLQAFYLHVAFWNGWGFNAPSWSVAAEILAYLSFFYVASRHRKRYWAFAVAILLFGLDFETNVDQSRGGLLLLNGLLARGLVGFYAGSLGYLAMRKAVQLGYRKLFGGASLGAFLAVVILARRFGYNAWIGASAAANALVVFPPLIFACLCLRPLGRLLSVRPLVFLGDISYSIYLVHVPVQMLALALARAAKFSLPIRSPWFMAAYAATVVVAGTAVRYGLEKPASRWLRGRFLPRAAPVGQPAPALAAAQPAAAASPNPAVIQ